MDIQTNTHTGQLLRNVGDTDMTNAIVMMSVNKTQVGFARLNDYLFDFCMPKAHPKLSYPSMSVWTAGFSLSLGTGDAEARTHAKPDVLLPILV